MQPHKPSVDGLLLLDKKTGITSHDAVEKFRRRSKIKKVGHTGTLDPLATGLLVLCVGKATRLQAYLMGMEKTYEGVIQFGWATDSYDAAGEPAGETNEVNVEHIDFAPLVAPFIGPIEQMPPQFSAKKVNGVRAYELARKGEVAALTPKSVTVYEFEIVERDRIDGALPRPLLGRHLRPLPRARPRRGRRHSGASQGTAPHRHRQLPHLRRAAVRHARKRAARRAAVAAVVPVALGRRAAARRNSASTGGSREN